VSDRTRFDAFELDDAIRRPGEDQAVAGLVGLGRELEALDATPAASPGGFADGVMAAIASEPTPRPSLAVPAAARARRPFALLAGVRDAFRVTFGGASRPFGARLAAAPVALGALLLVGSIGVLGAGAAGVRLSGPRGPAPSVPVVAPPTLPSSAAPRLTPAPSAAEPTQAPTTAEPSPSPEEGGADATASPAPRATTMPTAAPTRRPSATETPHPSETPEPSHHDGSEDDHPDGTATPAPAESQSSDEG
jgi:hypothetical protein